MAKILPIITTIAVERREILRLLRAMTRKFDKVKNGSIAYEGERASDAKGVKSANADAH